MRITILNLLSDRREYINKDVMGGYGEVTKIGDSFLAKLIEKKKKAGTNLPLLSLAYMAAIFSQNGHEVDFTTNTTPDSDIVIIHSSIVDYRNEIETADSIRANGSKVGFVGPFASVKPEIYRKHSDFIIKGEPEQAAMKINEKIPEGIIESEKIKDLDSLPYPKWEIFPISEYSYKPLVKRKPFLPVLSSRGCPYVCNYCPYKAHYGNYRQRSIENIIKEIEHLVGNFGIKGIQFRDPLFTFNKNRSRDIALSMIEKKLDVQWGCETHFNFLDKDLIDVLYDAGMRSINVGIESSNPKILKNATRITSTIKHQEEMIEYCNKKGIRVAAFYILGLPNDTEDSINKTIEYAKKLNTTVAQFFISTPFPGTEFYEKMKKDVFTDDWEQFNSFTPVFKHKNLSCEQLLKLKEKAFVSYYFRPSYLFKFLSSKLR
ncbi:MAG: radical SAM protein [Candidatus Aenigmarchaeota archaeon]|nr:radical SAM protein [Candidatus Aenigmarchaeota archaeon]